MPALAVLSPISGTRAVSIGLCLRQWAPRARGSAVPRSQVRRWVRQVRLCCVPAKKAARERNNHGFALFRTRAGFAGCARAVCIRCALAACIAVAAAPREGSLKAAERSTAGPFRRAPRNCPPLLAAAPVPGGNTVLDHQQLYLSSRIGRCGVRLRAAYPVYSEPPWAVLAKPAQ